MESRIVVMEDMTLAGIDVDTTMEQEKNRTDCPNLWVKFTPKMAKIKETAHDKRAYGVSLGKKDSMDFNYMAAVRVMTDKKQRGFKIIHLPKARYLAFTHKGDIRQIHQTYEKVFSEGVKRHSIDFSLPTVEVYDDRFTNDERSEMDILVPIF